MKRPSVDIVRGIALRGVAIAALRFAPLVATVLVIAMRAAPAHADSVDTLIKQLEDSSDRVRVQAATSLQRSGDKRAILPFIKRLDPNVEGDRLVRQAAASALGSLVNKTTPGSIRNLAIKALQKAEANDPDSTVKKNASASLKALGAGGSDTGGGPAVSSGKGGIYVNIGAMSAKTGTEDAKMRDMMVKTAQKTLTRVASNMTQAWPGGGAPPSNQSAAKQVLEKKQIAGFYVDGTLNVLDTKTGGGSATITCKVSMLLASYPDKSIFGMLNGGAKVSSSDKAKDISLAREDCVVAVIEDLISSKIVPTIKTKVQR